jgi:hypothetical protein
LDEPDLGVDAFEAGVGQAEFDGGDDGLGVFLDPADEVGECGDAAAFRGGASAFEVGAGVGGIGAAVEVAQLLFEFPGAPELVAVTPQQAQRPAIYRRAMTGTRRVAIRGNCSSPCQVGLRGVGCRSGSAATSARPTPIQSNVPERASHAMSRPIRRARSPSRHRLLAGVAGQDLS